MVLLLDCSGNPERVPVFIFPELHFKKSLHIITRWRKGVWLLNVCREITLYSNC